MITFPVPLINWLSQSIQEIAMLQPQQLAEIFGWIHGDWLNFH